MKKCDHPGCSKNATVFSKRGAHCMLHAPAIHPSEFPVTIKWKGRIHSHSPPEEGSRLHQGKRSEGPGR